MIINGAIWGWLQKQADLCEAGSRDALLETCRRVVPVATMLDCGCSDGWKILKTILGERLRR